MPTSGRRAPRSGDTSDVTSDLLRVTEHLARADASMRATSHHVLVVAVDEDRHIALPFARIRRLSGAGLELLGRGVGAAIFGRHRPRRRHHLAVLDLARWVDRQRHHLPAKEGLARLDSGLRLLPGAE